MYKTVHASEAFAAAWQIHPSADCFLEGNYSVVKCLGARSPTWHGRRRHHIIRATNLTMPEGKRALCNHRCMAFAMRLGIMAQLREFASWHTWILPTRAVSQSFTRSPTTTNRIFRISRHILFLHEICVLLHVKFNRVTFAMPDQIFNFHTHSKIFSLEIILSY